jgi:hypothetical protein
MAIQRQTTPASLGENKAVFAKYVLYRMRQHIVARNVVRTIVGGEGGGGEGFTGGGRGTERGDSSSSQALTPFPPDVENA